MSHLREAPQPETRDAEALDFLSLLQVLWREKLLLCGSVATMVLLGGIYAFLLATPVYRATAVVMLESRESAMLGLNSVLGGLTSGESAVVNTEVEVLRGRTLMARVVDELDLTNDPEFNLALEPPGPIGRLKDMLAGGADPPPSEALIRDNTVTQLLTQTGISNVPQSLVFHITVASTSPEKAARIADTLTRLYINDQLRVRFEATEAATKWLSDQVAILRTEFEAAEREVRAFRNDTNLISAENLEAMDRQQKETRRRIEQMQADLTNLQNHLARIAAASDPAEKSRLIGDDQLRGLASSDPAAWQLRLDQILARMADDQSRLQQQINALIGAEAALSNDINRQSQDLVRLEQLEREAESSRLLHEHFQTRLKETAAQQGINQPDSRILSDAVTPRGPYAPRKALILVAAAVFGAIIGTAIILLRELTTSRIRSARELEALTGQIVLSQIPAVPQKSRQDVISWLGRNPTSAPAEAIRNLRTSVLLTAKGDPPQIIAMTSSIPGEGKTTTALALAQNLTMMGRRVLLIEGDMRMRTIGLYIGNQPGGAADTASVIRGEHSLAQAVLKVEGIADILPGAEGRTNAADLFSSPGFLRLLDEARKRYDIILIDTPPVLVVPDARIIARHADTTVFVVRWDHTPQAQVSDALQQLAQVRVPVAGLVLSQVDPAGMRRYGHGGYYGAYSRDGEGYYSTGPG
ncbi:AAA family ATPase [Xinfangfangia sp. D13-10-4-6]|uniref:GumC family protein n=1 Tax=Pseudogemmobacter hezensis TaxID=2737662 RepID=UPI0015571779|nr:Wzz/FepE/Etk N-terminal domain-containing protein [Pseudogemmobacter hezensis]NPD16351.1 AAA family ATPase [Pseudogemmobacter hezensis]